MRPLVVMYVGDVVTEPSAINDVFRYLYSHLSTSEYHTNTQKCTLFLQKLLLPSFEYLDNLKLKDPIS